MAAMKTPARLFTALLFFQLNVQFNVGCIQKDKHAPNVAHAATTSSSSRGIASLLEPVELRSIRARQPTVSGVSSGGFMAIQLFVAHSNTFEGAGTFAGGIYGCAKGQKDFMTLFEDNKKSLMAVLGSRGVNEGASRPTIQSIEVCMQRPSLIDVDFSVNLARQNEASGVIDKLTNLQNKPVAIFQGDLDPTVLAPSAEKLDQFLKRFGSRTRLTMVSGLGHALPSPKGSLACGTTGSPFLAKCSRQDGSQVDGAGEVLRTLYGQLRARTEMDPQSLYRFSQSQLINAASATMSGEGFVYWPKACRDANSNCRLHVALHGCHQNGDAVGDEFARNAGYNEWAEANGIVILYPNAAVSQMAHPMSIPFKRDDRSSSFGYNPNGCWDWFAYTGAFYTTQEAPQIEAIKKMVDFLMK